MGIGKLLPDGVVPMVLGMATVYIFLTIMIYIMKLMSKLLAPYAAAFEPQPKAASGSKKKKVAPAGQLSAQDRILALAAIEAVKQHRAK